MHAALLSVIFKKIIFYFQMWRDTVAVLRVEEEQEKSANSLSHAKQIMKNSVRGQRSMVEQDALAEVLSTLSCVPKMSSMDMDLLTNNIECIDCTGRTLIFLQGDFGACFYIIATGNIELYLEPSKDKEMSNCRNFGVFRGNSFDLEQCGALGRHIVTLKAGQGFGEYAILSSTHKFRGASAVAADDCLLFIVYADTYNATLRKHHFRQQQMSSAIALLKELPIFNFQSNAKIAQFAYNLRCQTYSPRTIIARASAKINTLYLISSGAIKVVSNKSTEYEEEQQDELSMHVGLTKRLDLCALEFGRGQIIGLWEILKDQSVYDMTYITSASCELLEISSQYFQV
jgi:CRP-like cAMP-binding protein